MSFLFWTFPCLNYEDSLNIASLMVLYFLYFVSYHTSMGSVGIGHLLEVFLEVAVMDIST